MLDAARTRRYLKDFDPRNLFIEEMGWDQHRQELAVPVDSQDLRLQAVEHKDATWAGWVRMSTDGK